MQPPDKLNNQAPDMSSTEGKKDSHTRNIERMQLQIASDEAEIGILTAMSVSTEVGKDAAPETVTGFTERCTKDVGRFGGDKERAGKYIRHMFLLHMRGDPSYAETIDTLRESVQEKREDIAQEEKFHQEFLDEKYAVN